MLTLRSEVLAAGIGQTGMETPFKRDFVRAWSGE